MKFTEAKLESAIIALLETQGYPHVAGQQLVRGDKGQVNKEQVLLEDDLRAYLTQRYQAEQLTQSEVNAIIRQLHTLPDSDLYYSSADGLPMVFYSNASK